jgi:hypothetical protein
VAKRRSQFSQPAEQTQEPEYDFLTTPEEYQKLCDEDAEFESVFAGEMGRPKVGRVTKSDVILYEQKLSTIDAGRWAENNHFFLPASGNRFSFVGHEYLIEPYADNSPYQIYLKAAQLGYSEMAVIKSFHDCAYRLKSGLIYYFPTKSDVVDFSKARFAPMIAENPMLKSLVKDTDAANIKRVGRCMMYLRGLRGAMGAKTAPADKIVFDEIDEADPNYVDMAKKRLSHSEFQEIVALSTPTIPDFGIDAMFQLTDQRYMMVYCEACRNYTCMEEEFPECLIMTPEGARRVCTKCQRELDLANHKNEYVAKYPGKELNGRPAVGRCISQLHSQYVSMDELLTEYWTTKFPQDFWNSRLARAYIDAQNRMEVAHIISMCGSHGMEQASQIPCCLGGDIGPKKHHVVIGRKEFGGSVKIMWIGETDWDGLDELMRKFNSYAVIDGLPEPAKATSWAKKFSYRAWACFYSNSPKTGISWDDDQKKVTVYQSMAMDASHAMLQEGKTILPRKSDVIETFAKHCHNVARKKIEDEETGSVYNKWMKLGEDHYRKAFSYMCLAMERTPESKYSGRDYSFLEGGIGRDRGGNIDLASSYM